jgi:hypothetical protein
MNRSRSMNRNRSRNKILVALRRYLEKVAGTEAK